MAGPNSAPNGDGRLVVGYFRAEMRWVEYYDYDLNKTCYKEVTLREYLARRKRLRTGKTV